MYRLLLSAFLALPLLATACSGPGCRDACERLVDDCHMIPSRLMGECVDYCRDQHFDDDEIECVAEMQCTDRAFDRCFDRKREREGWPGKR